MRSIIPIAKHVLLLTVIALLAAASASAQSRPDALADVKAALDAHVAAWNAGATEKPVTVYHDSPEMLWVNRTGIRKGIGPVQAAYRRGSATVSRLGTYTYETLHIEKLSPTCVYFVIRWRVEQNGRSAMTGVTSMLWKRINKKWVIAAEHAS